MKKKIIKRKKTNFSFSPIKKFLVMGISIVIIYFLFFAGSHGVIQYLRQKSHKHALMQEIDTLKVQKTKLKNESKRLKNDLDYIEKIAREKYNMKKKDEKVYKIIKEK